MTTLDYTFRNQRVQMDALQHYLDPITTSELTQISVAPGWRCLDVGAGGGSIAAILADLVGPDGQVTALDADTSLLTPRANLDIYTHDIRTGKPLPAAGPFDLIHARLLTQHLPQRRDVLHRLATALTPGGWLLCGEFVNPAPQVIDAPSQLDADLFTRVMTGLLDVLTDADIDMAWGNRLHSVMRAEGLTAVHTRWHAQSWTGGGHGSRLLANNADQKRDQLLTAGFTTVELDAFTRLLNNPHLVVRSYEFACTRGRRPA